MPWWGWILIVLVGFPLTVMGLFLIWVTFIGLCKEIIDGVRYR